jgi:hypothetical protein
MKMFILYGTLGCHLCEQAAAIVAPLLASDCLLEDVDISGSEDLMARYAIRIPVLVRQADGAELGWPFDQQQLLAFLQP